MSLKEAVTNIKPAVLSIVRIHFAYVGAYIAAIIAFDSWNLITHEGIVLRWTAAALMLTISAVVWYLVRGTLQKNTQFKLAAAVLIAADIIFAAYNVYWQRGMASKAVALFLVPIIIAAVLASRRAVLATAAICTAAYTFAAVKYFHLNYGEGYKVELYGEIGFYSAVFFIVASLLVVLIRKK